MFAIGKNILKFGFNDTKCVVKHAPKAIETVASVKRELIKTVSEEYARYQKEQQELALDAKIKSIGYQRNK